MNRFLIAVSLSVAVQSATVNAAQSSNLDNLAGVIILKGDCSRLTMAGNVASPYCKGMATNTSYKTGRSGFVFLAVDSAIVTFSGKDNPAVGDNASITLDKVIFSLVGLGTAPNSINAKGTCTYSNPVGGRRARIVCNATTTSGAFNATFVSDGSEPDVKEF